MLRMYFVPPSAHAEGDVDMQRCKQEQGDGLKPQASGDNVGTLHRLQQALATTTMHGVRETYANVAEAIGSEHEPNYLQDNSQDDQAVQ